MLNRSVLTMMILVLMAALTACLGADIWVEPGASRSAAGPTSQPAGLDGSEWLLTSLHGDKLIEGANITLSFSGGSFGGFAGCNGYGGRYTVAEGGALTISEVERQVQLCQTPEGIMRQEETFLKALSNAAYYRTPDDRLEIVNAAGETTLVFAKKFEGVAE